MPAVFWGALTAAFSRLFASRLGMWVTGLLVYMGIGIVAQKAVVMPSIDYIKDYIASSEITVAVQWMAYLNFDIAITMLFSAYATRNVLIAGKIALSKRT